MFEFADSPLDLVLAHEDGAEHKFVVLQVVQLLQVVNALRVAGTSPFLKLVSLLDGLKNGLDLQNLILEPHLDVNERIGQRLWQVIEILFELLILGVLEQ